MQHYHNLQSKLMTFDMPRPLPGVFPSSSFYVACGDVYVLFCLLQMPGRKGGSSQPTKEKQQANLF